MKRLVFVLALALGISLGASAQNGGHGGQHQPPTPEQITDRMTNDLGLNADQKSKVLELNKEYYDVILMGPRGGHGGPQGHGRPQGNQNVDGNSGATQGQPQQRPQMTEEQKAQFEARKAKREEYNNKVKAILDADQLAKFEEAQKRGPHGGQGVHGNGGNHGNHNANGHDKQKDNKGNKGNSNGQGKKK